MPAWLWVLIVVTLLVVVIGLLLRRRAGLAGRQEPSGLSNAELSRSVTVPEAASPLEVVAPAAAAQTAPLVAEVTATEVLTSTGATVAALPETDLHEDQGRYPAVTEEAELREDARERGDGGYVETFGNERGDDGLSSDYGPGSVVNDGDGTAPEGWTVRGNADSMLFYTPSAPGYLRARADVWFRDEETAIRAGFVPWNAHHR
jgi:hypothetical protein